MRIAGEARPRLFALVGGVALGTSARPAGANAFTQNVDITFDKLEANVGAIPGLPQGYVIDAAFRGTRRGGNIIRNNLKAVYILTRPGDRAQETTSALFQWHKDGSSPGDDEPDSLSGEVTVKKKYLLTTPTRQVKTYRGRWHITSAEGLYGAIFKTGSGTVTGRDDCTAAGCRGFIRFKGTLSSRRG